LDVLRQPNHQINPLPYRRVLLGDESDELWKLLLEEWSIRGQGYGWFPLNGDPAPSGSLTFHEELWESRGGDEPLRKFLVSRCVSEIDSLVEHIVMNVHRF
jgi:hypothetical protein